jgi:hypothetical protein
MLRVQLMTVQQVITRRKLLQLRFHSFRGQISIDLYQGRPSSEYYAEDPIAKGADAADRNGGRMRSAHLNTYVIPTFFRRVFFSVPTSLAAERLEHTSSIAVSSVQDVHESGPLSLILVLSLPFGTHLCCHGRTDTSGKTPESGR